MDDQSGSAGAPVKVWDLPTRLFHWSLVLLVCFSWWSGEQGGGWLKWHFLSGYAVLSLLLFRLTWGFIGSSTARFGQFLKGPKTGLAHLRVLFSAAVPRDFGHNPVGGWIVIFMLAVLTAQAGLGLFADDEVARFGPLNGLVSGATAERLTFLHKIGGKIVLFMVIFHVAAVAIYFIWKRLNLVAPMLSGYSAEKLEPAAAKFVNPWLALLILIAAALCVWGIVSLGK